ncbi:uncharacterized protein FPRN_06924 [Fusarium proliferatum]|nr:uncharacterized protein FPRN_06924 [Fusarium proliferatum]
MWTSYLVDKNLCKPLDDVVDSDIAGWGVIAAFTASTLLTLSAIIIGYILNALPAARDDLALVDHWFLKMLCLRKSDNPESAIELSPADNQSNNSTNEASPTQQYTGTQINTDPSSSTIATGSLRQTSSTQNRLALRSNTGQAATQSAQGPTQDLIAPGTDLSPDGHSSGTWNTALEVLILGLSDQQLITGMALLIPTLLMTMGLHGLNESLSVYSFKVVTMLAYFSFIVQLCSLTVVKRRASTGRYMRLFRACAMSLFLSLLIPCMVVSESVTFRFNSNTSVKCALENLHLIDPDKPGYTSVSDEAIILFNMVVLISVILLGYYRVVFGRPDATGANLESMFWKHLGLVDFKSSILFQIIWMIFYFVFGLANLYKFLIDKYADIGSIQPSFGQLVPLFLLVYPFILAFEVVSRKHHPTLTFFLRSLTSDRLCLPTDFPRIKAIFKSRTYFAAGK